MTRPLPITDFDFATQPTDSDLLIQAWMPEIKQAAITYVPETASLPFSQQLSGSVRDHKASKVLM